VTTTPPEPPFRTGGDTAEDAEAERQGVRTHAVHGPNGDFVPLLSTAERDSEMARLKQRGLSYRAIAKAMGCAESTAYEGVKRALKAARREGGEELLQMELNRLDDAEQRINDILDRDHVTVSHGRVVRRRARDENGNWIQMRHPNGELMFNAEQEPIWMEEEVLDDGAILQALRMRLQIQESRRKLLGLDAAQKVDLSGGLTYEIVGIPKEQL
jgi:transposase-like protein